MTEIVQTTSSEAALAVRVEIPPELQPSAVFIPLEPGIRLQPGWLSMVIFTLRGAIAACPDRVSLAFLRRSKITFRWLREIELLREWRLLAENQALGKGTRQHPLAMGVAVWPYIHAQWGFKKRVEKIQEHYRQVDVIAPQLAIAFDGSLLLAKLDDIRPGLKLVIDRASWFVREGELVLNIFLQDQRLFSIAFSLDLDNGRKIARIGGIQGVHGDKIVDLYRDLTKELFGLRPRDFLLDSLKLLCKSFGIDLVLAIADGNRQHRSSYFRQDKAEKLGGNYDEVWSEHDGILNTAGFFEISTDLGFRLAADIPARKRGLYRRRYEFLTQLELKIKETLAKSSAHES